jgi:cytoskeletal protein RodZ
MGGEVEIRKMTQRSGSVKVFVIVGVILALVSLGVLFGARRLSQNDQTPPMTVPEQTEDQQSDGQVVKPSTEDKTADDQQSSSDSGNDAASTDATDDEAAASTDTSNSTDSTTQTTVPAQTDDGLPQTGPAENFAALAAALVAFSAVAYGRSLRHL